MLSFNEKNRMLKNATFEEKIKGYTEHNKNNWGKVLLIKG